MIFGDPATFAVEAILEPGPEHRAIQGRNIAGRLRVWMGNVAVGDFDDPHCWLGPPSGGLLWMALDSLWHPSLEGLAHDAIFDRLNFVEFAADREGCLDADWDDADWARLEEEAQGMPTFQFLINTSEAFDGWKCFLLHPPGPDLVALVSPRDDLKTVHAFSFPVEHYRSASRAFAEWIGDETTRLLAQRAPDVVDQEDAATP